MPFPQPTKCRAYYFQGSPNPGELSQEDRLVARVISSYNMIQTHEGNDIFQQDLYVNSADLPQAQSTWTQKTQ